MKDERINQLECRALFVRETASAIQVQKDVTRAAYWIPRSQIGYMRKTTNLNTGQVDIVFTVPEWLVEKENFWELVP